jgi:hypothetical protein
MNVRKVALSLPMQENDANARTIREYLVALVERVWDEAEGFSGKRAFGNSDWQGEVYETLIEAGLADDEAQADSIIRGAIEEMK